MLKRLLSKRKKVTSPSPLSAFEKLNETLQTLEKKEHALRTQISKETQKAKDFAKFNNKKAAILCLKRKKLYEAQVDQLESFQLQLHDQMIMLEGAKATKETVNALRMSASTIKTLQQSSDFDEIIQAMEEVVQNSDEIKKVGEALAAPIGAAADIDEDELNAELEELEEAELEELVRPPVGASVANSYSSLRNEMKPNEDADGLATLQAEIAL